MKLVGLMLLLLILLVTLPGCREAAKESAAAGSPVPSQGNKLGQGRDKGDSLGEFSNSLGGLESLFEEDVFEGIDDF